MSVETEHFREKLLDRFSDLNKKNKYLVVGDQERRANNISSLFDSLASTGKLEIRRGNSSELGDLRYKVSKIDDQKQLLILNVRFAGKLSILKEEFWGDLNRMTVEDNEAVVQAFLEIYANVLSE